jgi:hypothetical protein
LVKVINYDSQTIGWLLGTPITPEGKLVNNHLFFKEQADEIGFEDKFESLIYSLGGRFIAISLMNRMSRVYLDSCGSLAAIFSRRHEIVASSPMLIPYSEGCDDNLQLISSIHIPGKRAWYPFGLTPRKGVERIMPNHYLCLSKWKTNRHWPKKAIELTTDISKSVSAIASIVKANISAVTEKYIPYFSITAGQDSRVLLACSRNAIQDINFFTVAIPDEIGRLDCYMGSKIAKSIQCNYSIIKVIEANTNDQHRWQYSLGCCLGEPRSQKLIKTFQQLDQQNPHMPGLVGELARGYFYYWVRKDSTFRQIDAQEILRWLKSPETPDTLKRAKQWIDNLRTFDWFTQLDLLYIEQRLGCWAGPLHYAEWPFRIYPLCHREILYHMLKLPVDYKIEKRLTIDIIRNSWPELLRFPFNQHSRVERLKKYAINKLNQGKRKGSLVVSKGMNLITNLSGR